MRHHIDHHPDLKCKKELLESIPVVGAVMRRLIHIIYGALKNNQPFDPNFQTKNA